MKVLVIPDCHLKPYMFIKAKDLMKKGIADRVVYLGDTPDDWRCEYNIDKYERTYDALIDLVKAFPDTLVCYGNHDISYLWRKSESGYSYMAEGMVRRKLNELDRALPSDNPVKFVHKIDNVIFSHAGVCDYFVEEFISEESKQDIDKVIDEINNLTSYELWNDASPLWLRPQGRRVRMYKPFELLQIVGHTPVERIEKEGNIISCDVFSTYPDGRSIGTCELLLLDTQTKEYEGIQI